ncbi:haloacid dehalogenase type II [Arthrobacter sp. MDT1-48-3]|uniref:Haloacid dehalogenase type II n=1 Tax=Arthrobacter agilis TaxID=37921 RepID=A0A2L0UIF3_9MICC|nr:haloacid dehalogenase type II [Arthrobacter agilis]AUZ89022.1 haloacid dehalogenase type II [Arthrobacter agilis]
MALPLVLFDVNGTLSDMGRMSQHFEEVGAPPQLAALWFASVLRDGFALTAVGRNPAFGDVAEGALRVVLADQVLNRDLDDAVTHVMTALQELPVHPDVADGIRALALEGFGVAVLTNGAAATAAGLLERAGVGGQIAAVLSVADAARWKPARESYAHALETLGKAAGDVVLVAVHPWDIDGAARAGLKTVWLNRDGGPYPTVMTPPDHEVASVGELPGVLRA